MRPFAQAVAVLLFLLTATAHSGAVTPEDNMQHDSMQDNLGEEVPNVPMANMPHDHEDIMRQAAQEGPQVGVIEKLGDSLPEGLSFTDSNGNTVDLKKLVDKPTMLLPVYFTCPSVCHILQSSFARILPEVSLTPGEEIQVISLSFDELDTMENSARAKANFAMALQGEFPPEHWTFLTGDKHTIHQATEALGFRFKRVGKDFAHPVVVIALAPGGKVVRYLYGSDFLPFDVTMAATEAAQGKTGVSIKRMLSYCFSYDPEGRRYTFDLMRVVGAGVLFMIGLFLLFLIFGGKKKKRR